MDNIQNPPTESQIVDTTGKSLQILSNSSTQVYYLVLNQNQIQLVNDANSTDSVSLNVCPS